MPSRSFFQANNVIRNFADDRLPLLTDSLDFSITMSGPDVLNTVSSMVDAASGEGKAGYFPKHVPSWVRNMANRGRNVVDLERKKREKALATEEGGAGERVATNSVVEDDLMSVAASDLTMAHWR